MLHFDHFCVMNSEAFACLFDLLMILYSGCEFPFAAKLINTLQLHHPMIQFLMKML